MCVCVKTISVTGSDLISGYVAASNAPPGQPTIVSATKEDAAETDAVRILYKRKQSRSTALQTSKSHAASSTQQPQELAASKAINRCSAATVSLVLVCVTLAMFAFDGSLAGARGGGEGVSTEVPEGVLGPRPRSNLCSVQHIIENLYRQKKIILWWTRKIYVHDSVYVHDSILTY